MQVPPMPTFPRFPGNENPYLAWTTFSRAIIDTFSRAPVISQHGKGLLGPLLTPAKYASLPGVPAGEAYNTPYPHPGDDPPVERLYRSPICCELTEAGFLADLDLWLRFVMNHTRLKELLACEYRC